MDSAKIEAMFAYVTRLIGRFRFVIEDNIKIDLGDIWRKMETVFNWPALFLLLPSY
jgi:hypothetical protein